MLWNPTLASQAGIELDVVTAFLGHQAGHWLGLLHTYQDGCSSDVKFQLGDPAIYDYLNSDGIADTPAHSGPTSDQPGEGVCWDTIPPLNTCIDIPGVDPGPDPVLNYMNLASARCQIANGEFTPMQIERMVAQYELYRANGPPVCAFFEDSCTRQSQCCDDFICLADGVVPVPQNGSNRKKLRKRLLRLKRAIDTREGGKVTARRRRKRRHRKRRRRKRARERARERTNNIVNGMCSPCLVESAACETDLQCCRDLKCQAVAGSPGSTSCQP